MTNPLLGIKNFILGDSSKTTSAKAQPKPQKAPNNFNCTIQMGGDPDMSKRGVPGYSNDTFEKTTTQKDPDLIPRPFNMKW